MDVVEAYEAKHSLPGVCTAGDVFLIYEDGAVYQISRVGHERATRIKLNRASLRPLHQQPSEGAPDQTPPVVPLKAVGH